MMNFYPQGARVVATPGVLVTLAVTQASPIAGASKLMVQPLPANVGKVYIGVAGMVRATFVGVITYIPQTAMWPPLFIESQDGEGNPIDEPQFRLDADNAGDGVIYTWVTV
jgi:hypothetical protein